MDEVCVGFVRYRFGEECFSCAWCAVEEDSFWWLDAEPFEEFGVFQGEFYHFSDFFDFFVQASDVFVGDFDDFFFEDFDCFGAEADFGVFCDDDCLFWVGVDDDELESAGDEVGEAVVEDVEDVFEGASFCCSSSSFCSAEGDLVSFGEGSSEESAFEDHGVCLDGDSGLCWCDDDGFCFFDFCSSYFDVFSEAGFGVSSEDAVHSDDGLSDV